MHKQSHLPATSLLAGAAASTAEAKKIIKYSDLPSHIDFIPVAIETTGVWGQAGLELVKELGHRISTIQMDPRSTQFLRQRIALAVQRGNAFCIQATHPRVSDINNLLD